MYTNCVQYFSIVSISKSHKEIFEKNSLRFRNIYDFYCFVSLHWDHFYSNLHSESPCDILLNGHFSSLIKNLLICHVLYEIFNSKYFKLVNMYLFSKCLFDNIFKPDSVFIFGLTEVIYFLIRKLLTVNFFYLFNVCHHILMCAYRYYNDHIHVLILTCLMFTNMAHLLYLHGSFNVCVGECPCKL